MPTTAVPTTMDATTALSPADTYTMHIDAIEHTVLWGSVGKEKITRNRGGVITAWTVQIREDVPGSLPVAVGHTEIIAALRAVADDPQRHDVSTRTATAIRAVLHAPTNEDATDRMTALDVYAFDALIQIAVIGDTLY